MAAKLQDPELITTCKNKEENVFKHIIIIINNKNAEIIRL